MTMPEARPPNRQTTQGSMIRSARVTVRTRWMDSDKLYRVCLEVPAENVRVLLTYRQAFDHAQAVIHAAARARYDAVMLSEFAGKFKVPVATVAHMVREARKHRKPLTTADPDPFRFDSGVDGKNRGYVAVSIGVDRLTRWSVAEADAYARTVLGMTERAELDTAAYRILTMWTDEEQRIRNRLAEMHPPGEF